MATKKQLSLSQEEKIVVLNILEDYGRSNWLVRWKEHMSLPSNIDPYSNDESVKEKVFRYLLIRVLINQQANFEKVRELSIEIAEEFTEKVLFKPYKILETELLKIFRKVAGEKGSLLYKVGSLGGIKPVSLFVYRFKAYEAFIKWLENTKQNLLTLVTSITKRNGVVGLYNFLKEHPLLEVGWVGNDPKACRMLVNWYVYLMEEVWKMGISSLKDTLMIVDGHVGKIFCRSGLLEEVKYEKKRPFIIEASKMRGKIEELVKSFELIPFYVDNGAFYLYENGYCLELDPNCKDCPLTKVCKKYIQWTAYKMFKK
jgi:hypothetical protein